MSQEQPPLEIVTHGVTYWDNHLIITNQLMQPEIANLSKGKAEISKISKATLKLATGREHYLTNIQIGNIRQNHGSQITTYEYVKTAP